MRVWLRRSSYPYEDEDELIQEAYVRMLAAPDLSEIGSGRAYFFVVVRNLVFEQMRRSQVVRIETMAEMADLEVPAETPSPEAGASSRQELALVKRVLESLPDRRRRIFVLRKVKGMKLRDVARLLGLSESLVEKEAARALQALLAGVAAAEQRVLRPRPVQWLKGERDALVAKLKK